MSTKGRRFAWGESPHVRVGMHSPKRACTGRVAIAPRIYRSNFTDPLGEAVPGL